MAKFMSITPRDTSYIGGVNTGIRLRVLQDDGVEIKPDIRFNKVDLNSGEKYYHNNSSPYASFSIKVLVHKNDKIGSVTVAQALDYYIRKGVPFYVNTKAIGLKSNVLYIINENSSRSQTSKSGYTKWSLTFTRYSDIQYANFKNNNTVVTKAVKQYAWNKLTLYQKLRRCDRRLLVYSKKKKFVKCVKVLQQILYKQKFLKDKKDIDGWYGKTTKNAVKAYQKKYKKDGLPVTGNMNFYTYLHIAKITQIGKTKTVTSKLPKAGKDGVVDTRTAAQKKAVKTKNKIKAA